MVIPMIKNYNYPLGNGETELYIGGYCPDIGGNYTVAYVKPNLAGWVVIVQGMKAVPYEENGLINIGLEPIKQLAMQRKTYRSAKIALGKINVSHCFCREMMRD